MEKNKVAGPDSIPIEFYQSCWDIVKNDIMNIFHEFHSGVLDVSRINYGIITLLPKILEAEKIQQFRPICLLNCLYKLITKVLTLRLEKVANKKILYTQSAFLKGRNIMNGVLALHEILHETKRNNEVGIVLKLDFEKAYDKVSWAFLLDVLKLSGFSNTWCSWIQKVVSGGTVSVKLNDVTGPYFVSSKGVRQGDPLSPILFNFVADCMARMVRKAQNESLIMGLASNIILKGVVLLQYADDTIVCLQNNIDYARNMKLLLYFYEMMSGLKINFSKSEVITIHGDDQLDMLYADLFNCQID